MSTSRTRLPRRVRHSRVPELLVALALLATAPAPQGAAVEVRSTSPPSGDVERALARSVPLLQRSMDAWFEERSCLSCHHQGLGSMAVALAEERGLPIDRDALDAQIDRIRVGPGGYAALLRGDFSINPSFGLSYLMLGHAAAGASRDDATDAMAYLLAGNLSDDGAHLSESHRPPLEDSPVTSTALASRALLLYGPEGRSAELEEKVRRSRRWLEGIVPGSNEERVMRLLGLGWTGAPDGILQEAARELEAHQRPDGGWAQTATLASDAYATGQALVALQQMGELAVDSEVYRGGVRFLLETQAEDGSWLVETRRRGPGLPYFETGFPHRLHQFISFAGTAWATMALCLSLEPGPSDVFLGTRPPRASRDALATEAGMGDVHRAAAFGTAEDLRRALRADPASLDARGPGGLRPLMLAVHDERKVELLLAAGAEVAAKADGGATALALAGWYAGAERSLQELLTHGASLDTDALDEALLRAVRTGERAKVEHLLEHGADLDTAFPDGRTPLLCAAVNGDLELLELLLERGADVDAVGFGGMTALSIAAYAGWRELAASLVAHGAALDTRDEQGMTPLAWAAKIDHGHGEIVTLLLAAGADPSLVCGGRTARQWAETFANRSALAALARWPPDATGADVRRIERESGGLPVGW